MKEHQHLRIADPAQRAAEKIADANVAPHLHAVAGPAQHDAFAMKFDIAHAAVGAGVVRIEAYRQRERVEPQGAARPGGGGSAFWRFEPHGFFSPAGLWSR